MSKGKNILVVDDDFDCRTLVRTVLTGSGYTVMHCADGIEAVEYLKSNQPDLVILDIMMPKMSGYDVAAHMKMRPETQKIPIIMLTAKSDPEDMMRGYSEFAVDYYIPKPFTAKQLVAGVEMVLAP